MRARFWQAALRPEVQRDAAGVTELEFVLCMAVELGIVDMKLLQPFIDQFRALDVLGNGRLGMADIHAQHILKRQVSASSMAASCDGQGCDSPARLTFVASAAKTRNTNLKRTSANRQSIEAKGQKSRVDRVGTPPVGPSAGGRPQQLWAKLRLNHRNCSETLMVDSPTRHSTTRMVLVSRLRVAALFGRAKVLPPESSRRRLSFVEQRSLKRQMTFSGGDSSCRRGSCVARSLSTQRSAIGTSSSSSSSGAAVPVLVGGSAERMHERWQSQRCVVPDSYTPVCSLGNG